MYLFQFEPLGGHSLSPFCLKVETYLRMNGIDYCAIESYQLLSRFSRGKMPVIQWNHKLIQDSEAIIKFLEQVVLPTQQKAHKAVDEDLTEKEKTMTTLVTSMLETGLTPIVVYFRWFDEKCWPAFRSAVFGKLPFPLAWFIPQIARKGAIRRLAGSGLTTYDSEELLEKASNYLNVLSLLLGKNKYLFGDKFHTVDAVMYGVISQLILFKHDTPLSRLASRHDNLVSYCKHMSEVLSKTKHRTIPFSELGNL